jgi:putative peptidoglycan lipid II flippase
VTTTAPQPTSRGASAVFAGILSSRIAGLVREMLLRSLLGIGAVADALAVALRIPNLLQNLLGEGVMSASFIPVYSRMVGDEDEDSGPVAATVAAILAMITVVLVAIVIVFARPITQILAFGLPDETLDLAVSLVRIVALGTGLLVMSAWCLGVLNSHRHFFLPYFAPVLWNAAQIAVLAYVAIEAWTPVDTATAVAWATVIGSGAQLAIQIPAVLRLEPGLRRRGWWVPRHPLVRSVLARFIPGIVARGAVQLSAYIDQFLASFLAAGAVSSLWSAQVLYLLPISLFVMSVAAAELPELSRNPASVAAARTRLIEGLERVWFFIGFTVVAYVLAGDLIVALLFQRSRFGPDDTTLVALVLAGYTLGMPAVATSRLLQNVLYSRGDARTPAQLATTRLVVSVSVGILLMFPLDQLFVYDGSVSGWASMSLMLEPLPAAVRENDDLPLRAGALGLALGAAAGAWVENLLLRSRVQLVLGERRLGGGRLVPVLTSSAISAVVLLATRAATATWPSNIRAVVVVGLAGLAYVVASYGMGVGPAREAMAALRRE